MMYILNKYCTKLNTNLEDRKTISYNILSYFNANPAKNIRCASGNPPFMYLCALSRKEQAPPVRKYGTKAIQGNLVEYNSSNNTQKMEIGFEIFGRISYDVIY